MGYCITVIANIVIKKDCIAEALEAINALHEPSLMEKQAGGGCSDGRKWYSWVNNPPEGGFTDIVEAIDAWRYDAEPINNPYGYQEVGDISIEHFNGEKWGDDEYLWKAIAPFVRNGSDVSYVGEDGEQWRFEFEDGKVKERTARVVWE